MNADRQHRETEPLGDYLREHLKCLKCGHKGASLQLPSWIDKQVGVQLFPTSHRKLKH
jgi:hypothetical protein